MAGLLHAEPTNETSGDGVTYSISRYSSVPGGPLDTLFQEYSRPVYQHVEGYPGAVEGHLYWLVYTGRRWFGMDIDATNSTFEAIIFGVATFHAFWTKAYSETTVYTSDPTTGDGPVGVDFYLIGERGDQVRWTQS